MEKSLFNLNCNATDINYIELFKNCKYYDQASLNFLDDPSKKNLIVMHFNVRSLAKNIDKLNECICDLKTKPSVIAIAESKFNQNRMSANINIYGYNFIHIDTKRAPVAWLFT